MVTLIAYLRTASFLPLYQVVRVLCFQGLNLTEGRSRFTQRALRKQLISQRTYSKQLFILHTLSNDEPFNNLLLGRKPALHT